MGYLSSYSSQGRRWFETRGGGWRDAQHGGSPYIVRGDKRGKRVPPSSCLGYIFVKRLARRKEVRKKGGV